MSEEMLGLDPLTGLPNYWYLLRELQRHAAIYKRYRHPFSLVLVRFEDLHGVKKAWGYTIGDAALAYVAALIQTHVRAVDICCQHTEDEFAILMPEANRQSGETLAWRFTESVVPKTLMVGEALVGVRLTCGAASCPRDGVEAEILLRAAADSRRLGLRSGHGSGQVITVV